MLYLDYSREPGQWTPNVYGGRENLEAVAFLQEMNATAYKRVPGAITIAEESTSWPGVTRPTHLGGLGFGFKWNMGWMHDSLGYVQNDPIHRQYHHGQMTFSMVYAYSENYVLPISHDEVVHGKGSLLRKMPGDRWQQLANLRAYLAYMWAHPGKQLLFMGSEFGQESEWAEGRELDWWLLDHADHRGVHSLVRDLNRDLQRHLRRCGRWTPTAPGFQWIDANDSSRTTCSASSGCPRTRRRSAGVRRELLRGTPPRLPARAAGGRPVDRGAQHRRRTPTPALASATSVRSRRPGRAPRPARLGAVTLPPLGHALAAPVLTVRVSDPDRADADRRLSSCCGPTRADEGRTLFVVHRDDAAVGLRSASSERPDGTRPADLGARPRVHRQGSRPARCGCSSTTPSTQLGLRARRGEVDPGNERALRVATRAGLRREGVLRGAPGDRRRAARTGWCSPGSPRTRRPPSRPASGPC